MSRQKEVQRIIDEMEDLPAMPATVSEVLQLSEDPNVEIGEVAQVIQDDPALAAKILQVSNSSYYGMKQYVGTLKLALVILGVREVRNIVLGISVFDTLKDEDMDMRVAQEIWNNSLRVAGMARHLSQRLELGLQGEEFMAGLLSDVGKMVLLRQGGEDYADLLLKFGKRPEDLCQEEVAEFGFTHVDISTALSEKWGLPKSLSDALWTQYPNSARRVRETEQPELTAVLRIAKAAMCDDFTKDETLRSTEDVEAWNALSNAVQPLPPDDRRQALREMAEEAAGAPPLPL